MGGRGAEIKGREHRVEEELSKNTGEWATAKRAVVKTGKIVDKCLPSRWFFSNKKPDDLSGEQLVEWASLSVISFENEIETERPSLLRKRSALSRKF